MALELDGQPFTASVASYLDHHPDRTRPNSAIYVRVILPIGNGVEVLALLDTGSPYCILSPDFCNQLGLRPVDGFRTTLNTRGGSVEGWLHRVDLTIPAEAGDDLEIDATVFAPIEWRHGEFLGYSGLLGRINFAIQPNQNKFFFDLPT